MNGFDRLVSFGAVGATSWTLRRSARFEPRHPGRTPPVDTGVVGHPEPVRTSARSDDAPADRVPSQQPPPASSAIPRAARRGSPASGTAPARPGPPTMPALVAAEPARPAPTERPIAAPAGPAGTRRDADTGRSASPSPAAPEPAAQIAPPLPIPRGRSTAPAVAAGSPGDPIDTPAVDPALVSAAVLRELRRRGLTGPDAHVVRDATAPAATPDGATAVSFHAPDGAPLDAAGTPSSRTADGQVTVRIDRVQVVPPTPPARPAPRPAAAPDPSPLAAFLAERARTRR